MTRRMLDDFFRGSSHADDDPDDIEKRNKPSGDELPHRGPKPKPRPGGAMAPLFRNLDPNVMAAYDRINVQIGARERELEAA